jgi:hypothetical protein
MSRIRLSCTLCLPGAPVELPIEYAAAIVFHGLVHHGLWPEDVARARRSTSMAERDRYTPILARWVLPGNRPWLTEWESPGDGKNGGNGRPLPTVAINRRSASSLSRHI